MEKFTPQTTKDGSFTFFSEEFNEAFHSRYGAKQEALKKFVEPCQLGKKALSASKLNILDICYGLGYNSAQALSTIESIAPECEIELIAIELNPQVCRQSSELQLLEIWEQPIANLLTELAFSGKVNADRLQARLFFEDARVTLQNLASNSWQADVIFLDPFSPPKCPQLWTVEFLNLVATCLKQKGILATYSSAAAVRTALLETNLEIGSTPGVGRRSPGTIASWSHLDLLPLSQEEREHLQTRAAIPYRDPQLIDDRQTILLRREEEQKISLLEPTSRWKQRWSRFHSLLPR